MQSLTLRTTTRILFLLRGLNRSLAFYTLSMFLKGGRRTVGMAILESYSPLFSPEKQSCLGFLKRRLGFV